MISLISLLMLTEASGSSGRPEVAREQPAVAQLELAPRDLGDAHANGPLLLGASPDGKTVYLLNTRSGELSSYRETGKMDEKPATLHTDSFSWDGRPCWFSVSNREVAIATPLELALFKLDGSLESLKQEHLEATSIAQLPNGDWGVGLIQDPAGRGPAHFSPSGKKDGPRPRVASFDGKLEVSNYGLLVEKDDFGRNEAAARALLLAAAPPERIYAVEVANYTVYELDRRLKLRGTLRQPKVQLEKGSGGHEDISIKASREAQMKAELETVIGRIGQDPARPTTRPKVESETFTYRVAIHAAAWDRREGKLLLLLDRGVVAPDYALDILDPTTGQVRRLLLGSPGGSDAHLSQIVAGDRYLWFRGRLGNLPTLRLDREMLQAAKPAEQLQKE